MLPVEGVPPVVSQYWLLIGGWKLVSILVLILLDTLMGIIVAIKKHQFSMSKWANWLDSSILTLGGGYLFLGVFVMAEPQFQALMPVAMGMIDLKLLNDLRLKFAEFGINIPGFSKKAKTLSAPK